MKTYVGIYFKKSGGLICIYEPDPELSPRFWYFKSGDDIKFIANNLVKLIGNRHGAISIHVNKTETKNDRQSATVNQIIGMIAGLSACRTVDIKLPTKIKVQSRLMQLLSIASKRDFKSKLITKKMHSNKYNGVYEITKMKSRQDINNHMWAYLFAYYGYLKDKIKCYNNKEHIHGTKETTEVRSSQDDGPGPQSN
jgi:hypothetical protein